MSVFHVCHILASPKGGQECLDLFEKRNYEQWQWLKYKDQRQHCWWMRQKNGTIIILHA